MAPFGLPSLRSGAAKKWHICLLRTVLNKAIVTFSSVQLLSPSRSGEGVRGTPRPLRLPLTRGVPPRNAAFYAPQGVASGTSQQTPDPKGAAGRSKGANARWKSAARCSAASHPTGSPEVFPLSMAAGCSGPSWGGRFRLSLITGRHRSALRPTEKPRHNWHSGQLSDRKGGPRVGCVSTHLPCTPRQRRCR